MPGSSRTAKTRAGNSGAGASATQATIRDVARLAGVGSMTVSRVLNHHPYVTETTAARVHKAIAKLGYSPNHQARSLRGARGKSIGLIVPLLHHPFYARIAHSIHRVASSQGYSVLMATSDEDPEKELAELQIMMQRNVDGLIIAPAAGGQSRLTAYPFGNVPLVTLDRLLEGAKFHSVAVENRAGSHLGVQHLIQEHQHRRIAFVNLRGGVYTLGNRYDGYRQAMKEAGLSPGLRLECASEGAMYTLLKKQLCGRARVTAIFAAHGQAICPLLHVLAKLGLSVPKDVAVLGFDDSDMFDLVEPPLSVVRQPIGKLGESAAEMLFSLLRPGPGSDALPRTTLLPVELVLRQSCGCRSKLRE